MTNNKPNQTIKQKAEKQTQTTKQGMKQASKRGRLILTLTKV
jgi:hypothetical protein